MQSGPGRILTFKGRRQATYANLRYIGRQALSQAVDKLWADDLCKGCG